MGTKTKIFNIQLEEDMITLQKYAKSTIVAVEVTEDIEIDGIHITSEGVNVKLLA